MNLLFTICGRAGSKGLKSKNSLSFVGLPLVYYTLAAAKLAGDELERRGDSYRVALSTDSASLAEIVGRQNDVPVYEIKRCEELSGDRVAKVSVILDCMKRCESHWNESFDYVVDLDITSPLRTKADVIRAIDEKKARPDTDVVYSVTGARKNPYFNQAIEVDGKFEKVIKADFVSRQQTPMVYDMNASIYAYEPTALINKDPKDFFNSNAGAIMMRDTGVLDIDGESDYEMMQILAEHYFFRRFSDYGEVRECAEQLYTGAK